MEMVSTANGFELETAKIRAAALIFRAINHELRVKILRLIHGSSRITVTEIYRKLGLEQSVASQHLAILRKARMVITSREKRYVYYSVNYKRLEEVEEISGRLTTPVEDTIN